MKLIGSPWWDRSVELVGRTHAESMTYSPVSIRPHISNDLHGIRCDKKGIPTQ